MSHQKTHGYQGKRKLGWCRLLMAGVVACIVSFACLLGVVLHGSQDRVQGQPQVMLILGCRVMPQGQPSILLQDRLDKALEYLQQQPEMLTVVSGGQGGNEPMSEAQAMQAYLIEHGVDAQRILLEDQSHNTWQNLSYSRILLQENGFEDIMDEMMVVSNGFHLARVRLLFGRAWNDEGTLSTLAAPTTHRPSRISMYLREPLALVKSFCFDRM